MPLSDETRQAFGMMIVRAKDAGTLSAKITYAELLIEILETGLLSDSKSGEYKRERMAAEMEFNEITKAMQVPERRLWVESEITRHSNNIAKFLLPLCVVNKYILLESNMFSFIDSKSNNQKE
jgi:hypothetical protein